MIKTFFVSYCQPQCISLIRIISITHSIVGIVSPITKSAILGNASSANTVYYQQLAMQIIDILLKNSLLQKMGGMVSLTDLYCIVNRARGTELLSPDDLYTACTHLPTQETIHSGNKHSKYMF